MSRTTASLESVQICIARVICIFFMMSVHVNPGPGQSSAVTNGFFAPIGYVQIDLLGRASVAALSFISGYLIIRTNSQTPFFRFFRRRFSALIIPMLVWNLLFVSLLLIKVKIIGAESGNDFTSGDASVVAALTGLTGPTANLSLFFLRDLFIAGLILHALRRWILNFPVAALALAVVVTLLDIAEPVLFRPAILVFLLAGAIWAGRTARLPARPDWRWMVAAGAAFATIMLIKGTTINALELGREAINLLSRAMLTGLVLAVAAVLAATGAGRRIALLERHIFETYLMHVPFISTLWFAWSALIGSAETSSYLLFFLGAPLVALAAGQAIGRLIDLLPTSAQRLLRGRITQPVRMAAKHTVERI